jgi:hypothetical protein
LADGKVSENRESQKTCLFLSLFNAFGRKAEI